MLASGQPYRHHKISNDGRMYMGTYDSDIMSGALLQTKYQLELAFDCVCGYGTALANREFLYPEYVTLLESMSMIRAPKQLHSDDRHSSNPFAIRRSDLQMLFVESKVGDSGMSDQEKQFARTDMFKKVTALSMKFEEFCRLCFYLACNKAFRVSDVSVRSVNYAEVVQTAIYELVNEHLQPYVTMQAPDHFVPAMMDRLDIQHLFHVHHKVIKKVFNHFITSLDETKVMHNPFRREQTKEFADEFQVSPYFLDIDQVYTLAARSCKQETAEQTISDYTMTAKDFPMFLLMLSHAMYSNYPSSRKYPTPEARLDAFLLSWSKPYMHLFHMDLSMDCEFTQNKAPTLWTPKPDQGPFEGGYRILIQGKDFSTKAPKIYAKFYVPGDEESSNPEEEWELMSALSVATGETPVSPLSPLELMKPPKPKSIQVQSYSQCYSSSRAEFVVPKFERPEPKVLISVINGSYTVKVTATLEVAIAVSNDGKEWSEPTPFVFHDEHAPLEIKKDDATALLTIFQMYAEESGIMSLLAWEKFNQDLGITTSVTRRFNKYSKMNASGKVTYTQSLVFAQFLAALVDLHHDAPDIDAVLRERYYTSAPACSLQAKVLRLMNASEEVVHEPKTVQTSKPESLTTQMTGTKAKATKELESEIRREYEQVLYQKRQAITSLHDPIDLINMPQAVIEAEEERTILRTMVEKKHFELKATNARTEKHVNRLRDKIAKVTHQLMEHDAECQKYVTMTQNLTTILNSFRSHMYQFQTSMSEKDKPGVPSEASAALQVIMDQLSAPILDEHSESDMVNLLAEIRAERNAALEKNLTLSKQLHAAVNHKTSNINDMYMELYKEKQSMQANYQAQLDGYIRALQTVTNKLQTTEMDLAKANRDNQIRQEAMRIEAELSAESHPKFRSKPEDSPKKLYRILELEKEIKGKQKEFEDFMAKVKLDKKTSDGKNRKVIQVLCHRLNKLSPGTIPTGKMAIHPIDETIVPKTVFGALPKNQKSMAAKKISNLLSTPDVAQQHLLELPPLFTEDEDFVVFDLTSQDDTKYCKLLETLMMKQTCLSDRQAALIKATITDLDGVMFKAEQEKEPEDATKTLEKETNDTLFKIRSRRVERNCTLLKGEFSNFKRTCQNDMASLETFFQDVQKAMSTLVSVSDGEIRMLNEKNTELTAYSDQSRDQEVQTDRMFDLTKVFADVEVDSDKDSGGLSARTLSGGLSARSLKDVSDNAIAGLECATQLFNECDQINSKTDPFVAASTALKIIAETKKRKESQASSFHMAVQEVSRLANQTSINLKGTMNAMASWINAVQAIPEMEKTIDHLKSLNYMDFGDESRKASLQAAEDQAMEHFKSLNKSIESLPSLDQHNATQLLHFLRLARSKGLKEISWALSNGTVEASWEVDSEKEGDDEPFSKEQSTDIDPDLLPEQRHSFLTDCTSPRSLGNRDQTIPYSFGTDPLTCPLPLSPTSNSRVSTPPCLEGSRRHVGGNAFARLSTPPFLRSRNPSPSPSSRSTPPSQEIPPNPIESRECGMQTEESWPEVGNELLVNVPNPKLEGSVGSSTPATGASRPRSDSLSIANIPLRPRSTSRGGRSSPSVPTGRGTSSRRTSRSGSILDSRPRQASQVASPGLASKSPGCGRRNSDVKGVDYLSLSEGPALSQAGSACSYEEFPDAPVDSSLCSVCRSALSPDAPDQPPACPVSNQDQEIQTAHVELEHHEVQTVMSFGEVQNQLIIESAVLIDRLITPRPENDPNPEGDTSVDTETHGTGIWNGQDRHKDRASEDDEEMSLIVDSITDPDVRPETRSTTESFPVDPWLNAHGTDDSVSPWTSEELRANASPTQAQASTINASRNKGKAMGLGNKQQQAPQNKMPSPHASGHKHPPFEDYNLAPSLLEIPHAVMWSGSGDFRTSESHGRLSLASRMDSPFSSGLSEEFLTRPSTVIAEAVSSRPEAGPLSLLRSSSSVVPHGRQSLPGIPKVHGARKSLASSEGSVVSAEDILNPDSIQMDMEGLETSEYHTVESTSWSQMEGSETNTPQPTPNYPKKGEFVSSGYSSRKSSLQGVKSGPLAVYTHRLSTPGDQESSKDGQTPTTSMVASMDLLGPSRSGSMEVISFHSTEKEDKSQPSGRDNWKPQRSPSLPNSSPLRSPKIYLAAQLSPMAISPSDYSVFEGNRSTGVRLKFKYRATTDAVPAKKESTKRIVQPTPKAKRGSRVPIAIEKVHQETSRCDSPPHSPTRFVEYAEKLRRDKAKGGSKYFSKVIPSAPTGNIFPPLPASWNHV